MKECIDHTKEVETRLSAIKVSSQDVCSFFEMREGCLINFKQCFYCKYGVFNEQANTAYQQGLCKMKR